MSQQKPILSTPNLSLHKTYGSIQLPAGYRFNRSKPHTREGSAYEYQTIYPTYTVGGVDYDAATGRPLKANHQNQTHPNKAYADSSGDPSSWKEEPQASQTEAPPAAAKPAVVTPAGGRNTTRTAPDGSVQTGTNTGFTMSLGDFEAFAGAEIVDPFSAAAKPGQVEFDAEIQVADKFTAPEYSAKSTPKSNIDVDFTQHSSGFHEFPEGDVGNVGYDVSKSAPISKINPETGGGSGEIDFKRRNAFLDGPGGSLGGTKRVNAGLGYQQVGGKHFMRQGDEMVELDMANYGNGDQGFFAMKNAYRRGEIDAQTFLAGKTAEVKGAMKGEVPEPADAQQPNFTTSDPVGLPAGSETFQNINSHVSENSDLDVNTGYRSNINPSDMPEVRKAFLDKPQFGF